MATPQLMAILRPKSGDAARRRTGRPTAFGAAVGGARRGRARRRGRPSAYQSGLVEEDRRGGAPRERRRRCPAGTRPTKTAPKKIAGFGVRELGEEAEAEAAGEPSRGARRRRRRAAGRGRAARSGPRSRAGRPAPASLKARSSAGASSKTMARPKSAASAQTTPAPSRGPRRGRARCARPSEAAVRTVITKAGPGLIAAIRWISAIDEEGRGRLTARLPCARRRRRCRARPRPSCRRRGSRRRRGGSRR